MIPLFELLSASLSHKFIDLFYGITGLLILIGGGASLLVSRRAGGTYLGLLGFLIAIMGLLPSGALTCSVRRDLEPNVLSAKSLPKAGFFSCLETIKLGFARLSLRGSGFTLPKIPVSARSLDLSLAKTAELLISVGSLESPNKFLSCPFALSLLSGDS